MENEKTVRKRTEKSANAVSDRAEGRKGERLVYPSAKAREMIDGSISRLGREKLDSFETIDPEHAAKPKRRG